MLKFCILSQDKKNIVQGNQIGTNDESNSVLLLDTIRLEDFDYGLTIGTYESSERCREIIQEIYNKSEDMLMYNEKIIFYEMPEK